MTVVERNCVHLLPTKRATGLLHSRTKINNFCVRFVRPAARSRLVNYQSQKNSTVAPVLTVHPVINVTVHERYATHTRALAAAMSIRVFRNMHSSFETRSYTRYYEHTTRYGSTDI